MVEIHSEDILDTEAVIMCATVLNCVYCVLFVILRQLCFILYFISSIGSLRIIFLKRKTLLKCSLGDGCKILFFLSICVYVLGRLWPNIATITEQRQIHEEEAQEHRENTERQTDYKNN